MLNDLLDALGYVGSALDKPGRAVRGFMAGRPDEALALVPFSDALGVTDPTRRTSGEDLLQALGVHPGEGVGGQLAGFATEIATDPLTWTGVGAGRLLGKSAEGAAAARGPRYGTTADDLRAMVAGSPEGKALSGSAGDLLPTPVMGEGGRSAGRITESILKSPEADRILAEIPEGSKLLGSGAEGMGLLTPQGDVLRIGRQFSDAPLPGRPVDPNVLQATRAADFAGFGPMGWRAERAPYALNVENPGFFTKDKMAGLDADMRTRGLAFTDQHAGNVGTVGGRPVVIDPGAVTNLPGYAGGFQPVARGAEPSAPMNALLDALGGDPMIRRAVEAGQMGPDLVRKLGGYGGFLGADLGAWGRTQTGR